MYREPTQSCITCNCTFAEIPVQETQGTYQKPWRVNENAALSETITVWSVCKITSIPLTLIE